MLRKRMILLGVSVTALGAILASSAFAAQSVPKTSSSSASVGVTAASAGDLSVDITAQPPTIPATGTYHPAGTVTGTDSDVNYGYSISVPTLASVGTFSAGCTVSAVNDFAIDAATGFANTGGLNTFPQTIGSVKLSFDIAADLTCTHSGGMVSATFTTVGPN